MDSRIINLSVCNLRTKHTAEQPVLSLSSRSKSRFHAEGFPQGSVGVEGLRPIRHKALELQTSLLQTTDVRLN